MGNFKWKRGEKITRRFKIQKTFNILNFDGRKYKYNNIDSDDDTIDLPIEIFELLNNPPQYIGVDQKLIWNNIGLFDIVTMTKESPSLITNNSVCKMK